MSHTHIIITLDEINFIIIIDNFEYNFRDVYSNLYIRDL